MSTDCPGKSCPYTGEHEHGDDGRIIIRDNDLYEALSRLDIKLDIVERLRRMATPIPIGYEADLSKHPLTVTDADLTEAAYEIETLRAILKGLVGQHVEYSGSGQAWTYPSCLSGCDAHGQFNLTDEQDAALQRACWPEFI